MLKSISISASQLFQLFATFWVHPPTPRTTPGTLNFVSFLAKNTNLKAFLSHGSIIRFFTQLNYELSVNKCGISWYFYHRTKCSRLFLIVLRLFAVVVPSRTVLALCVKVRCHFFKPRRLMDLRHHSAEITTWFFCFFSVKICWCLSFCLEKIHHSPLKNHFLVNVDIFILSQFFPISQKHTVVLPRFCL